MKKIYAVKPTVLLEVESVLANHYPTLLVVASEMEIVIQGVFPVQFEQVVLDRFMIEITVPPMYPRVAPFVKEIGGRIPVDADRHVIPSSGNLCLFLRDEQWKSWRSEDGFEEFLKSPVNDYFLSQLYFEKHGKYPFGDRRHGVNGIVDFYSEELETDDIEAIVHCLTYLSRKEIKAHWACYCGSGKIMRKCHWEKIRMLHENIPSNVARTSLYQILETLKKSSSRQ